MANDNGEIHGGKEAYRLLEVFHPLREGIFNDAIAALDYITDLKIRHGLDTAIGLADPVPGNWLNRSRPPQFLFPRSLP